MYKYKILVLDDKIYKFNAIVKYFPESDFISVNVSSLAECIDLLSNSHFDIIFIDLRLSAPDDNYYNLDTNDILSIYKLSKHSIRVVYTEFTDNFNTLYSDLAFKHVVHFWVDYNIIKQSKINATIEFDKIKQELNYGSNLSRALNILHLSDLHFGKQFLYAGSQIDVDLSDLICACLTEYVSKGGAFEDIAPHLIVCSGDLSNSGTISEFQACSSFFKTLTESLQNAFAINHISILFCPGNHDLNWNLSIPEVCFINNDKSLTNYVKPNMDYQTLKWHNLFNTLDDDILGFITSNRNCSWWNYDFTTRFGIYTTSFNTSINLNYLNENDLLLDRNSLSEISCIEIPRHAFGIFICHHPISYWFRDDKPRKEMLQYLFNKLHIRLIFSGHKHSSEVIPHKLLDRKKIVEIQTGSASSLDIAPNSLPHFRIVQLRKEQKPVFDFIRHFDFVYHDGRYILATTKDYDEESLY